MTTTTTTTTARITDDQEIDALRVLRASYWESVRDIAQDIAGEPDLSADDVSDRVAESVDGSQWIIYTWRARLVRSLSDHGDACEEYRIEDLAHASDDLDAIITRAAYLAMHDDVREVFDRITASK